MNKYQYQQKFEAYSLLTSSSAFVAEKGFIKTKSADTIDLATATAKHKAHTEKAKSNGGETPDIAAETPKAKQALMRRKLKKSRQSGKAFSQIWTD